jgi:hypothetical protein
MGYSLAVASYLPSHFLQTNKRVLGRDGKFKISKSHMHYSFPYFSDFPIQIHLMLHEYVLFISRLASFSYSQIHDECWPIFIQRLNAILNSGMRIEDCQKAVTRLFHNIVVRYNFKQIEFIITVLLT